MYGVDVNVIPDDTEGTTVIEKKQDSKRLISINSLPPFMPPQRLFFEPEKGIDMKAIRQFPLHPIAARYVLVYAKLQLTDGERLFSSKSYIATGFHVTRTLILTSGHLIVPPTPLIKVAETRIVVTKPNTAFNLHHLPSRGIPATIFETGMSRLDNDYKPDKMILQIEPENAPETLPSCELAWRVPQELGFELRVYGFPSFDDEFICEHGSELPLELDQRIDLADELRTVVPPNMVADSTGELVSYDTGPLRYDASTTPGFSGGPCAVLITEPDPEKGEGALTRQKWVVIGVHWGATTLHGEYFSSDDYPEATPLWEPRLKKILEKIQAEVGSSKGMASGSSKTVVGGNSTSIMTSCRSMSLASGPTPQRTSWSSSSRQCDYASADAALNRQSSPTRRACNLQGRGVRPQSSRGRVETYQQSPQSTESLRRGRSCHPNINRGTEQGNENIRKLR